jgi:hypothetical protein
MDCLKSFSFIISGNQNIASPEANFWGLAPQNYWDAQIGVSTTSRINIQGYKNINLHKISAIGTVESTINSTTLGIVNEWSFLIRIWGQNAIIGNAIVSSPNKFNLTQQPQDPYFSITKYIPNIEFSSPIQSCNAIEIISLNAQGIGAQNLALLNLNWNINFICYYSFEGE